MHFPCLSLKNRKLSIFHFANDIILMSQTRLCPTRQLTPLFYPFQKIKITAQLLQKQCHHFHILLSLSSSMAHNLIYQVHLCFQGIHLQPVYLGGYCCKLDDWLDLFLLLVCDWVGIWLHCLLFWLWLRGRELGSLCSLFFYVNIKPKLLFLTSKKFLHALAICKSSVWEHTAFIFLSGEDKK